MVNLKDVSERNGEERRTPMITRNHHNWGSRFGRRRAEVNREPQNLRDLEEQAQISVQLMEKYNPKSEHNYQKVMDLLRLQYNMNFIVVCDKCNGPHINDELLAPER